MTQPRRSSFQCHLHSAGSNRLQYSRMYAGHEINMNNWEMIQVIRDSCGPALSTPLFSMALRSEWFAWISAKDQKNLMRRCSYTITLAGGAFSAVPPSISGL